VDQSRFCRFYMLLESHVLCSIIFIHGLRGHPRQTWASAPCKDLFVDDLPQRNSFRRSFTARRKSRTANEEDNNSLNTFGDFWPEDYLTQDIPQARIWTYGYEADVIKGSYQANNKTNILQHGRDLAARLEREVDKVRCNRRTNKLGVLNLCRDLSFSLLIVWAAL
jgi:hypothetical protein